MVHTTSDTLLTTGAGILGIGVAVGLGVFFITPAMLNTCTLFNKRCAEIKYQSLSNGELLVKDPSTSITYWFDGNFIRAYGPTLPGTCPSTIATGATGVYKSLGENRILCNHFNADGVCVSQDASETPPTALTGTPVATSQGRRILEPAFVMNATTLLASEQQVLCSRARNVVENAFEGVPFKKIKVNIPEGTDTLDASQMFKALKYNSVYTPPSINPEPPVCNGHGTIDTLTTSCICDAGYTGARCATKMCTHDAECVNGTCSAGLCECEEGWMGDTCEMRGCPTQCVNGQCDGTTGVCVHPRVHG